MPPQKYKYSKYKLLKLNFKYIINNKLFKK